jgi:hypothetical protein
MDGITMVEHKSPSFGLDVLALWQPEDLCGVVHLVLPRLTYPEVAGRLPGLERPDQAEGAQLDERVEVTRICVPELSQVYLLRHVCARTVVPLEQQPGSVANNLVDFCDLRRRNRLTRPHRRT